MRDIATELIDRQQQLETDRSTFENHWSEIAPLVLTRQDDFFNQQRQGGEKRNENKFDDTAALAIDRGAAAVNASLTPASQKWHGLAHHDERVNEDQEAAEWYDNVTDLLFRLRYSIRANFAAQQHENYLSLLAFGTGVKIVEELPGTGIRYKTSHLSEHYYMENIHGKVDTDYRKYRLTAYQAAEKFGHDKLPEQIKKALEKSPNDKFWFIHCVRPNPDHVEGSINPQKWKFLSFHVAVDGKKLLGTGSFRTFPFIISRWNTAPCEIYGRSPAMEALAEIKMLNAMRKSDLRARHMAIDPPILAADETTIRRLSMKPRSINYGTLDAQGNPLVRPFENNYKGSLSNDVIQQSREFINDVFLVTLFQILVDHPQMTATEVLQRAQEKGDILSPSLGRLQSEDLGPMIEREIDILDAHGYFDEDGPLPMPQVIQDMRDNYPDDYKIEYNAPFNKMQKAGDALATERTVQSALPLIELDPTLRYKFDWNQYVDIIGDANGAPAKLFKSDDEIAEMIKAENEQKAAQQMVESAGPMAGAIKDIAQAQALGEQ